MDKEILRQYIDACELVREAKEDLAKIKKARSRIEKDKVMGSSHEFPYTMKSFQIEGVVYATGMDKIEQQEEKLKSRIKAAERLKEDVDKWMLTISPRMQRIIRYKIFEEMTWAEVSERMGRKATELSIKKEYQRFMKDK